MRTSEQRGVASIAQGLANSVRAYVTAAEHAGWDDLERLLREVAERRQRFIAQLEPTTEGLETPSRSVGGVLRERWMALRDRLSEDHYGLLVELVRGEAALLARYERTITESALPQRVERLLRAQRLRIEETHAILASLRDGEKAAREA